MTVTKSNYIEFFLKHSDNIEMVRDIGLSLLEDSNIMWVFFCYESALVEFYIKNKDRFPEVEVKAIDVLKNIKIKE